MAGLAPYTVGERASAAKPCKHQTSILTLTRGLEVYGDTQIRSTDPALRYPDLRRAKAKRYILARPGVPGYFVVLQVFYRIAGGNSSIAYVSILARLQYDCVPIASNRQGHLVEICPLTGDSVPASSIP